jgi:hypothetical protein
MSRVFRSEDVATNKPRFPAPHLFRYIREATMGRGVAILKILTLLAASSTLKSPNKTLRKWH